jgi:hypothetical protein
MYRNCLLKSLVIGFFVATLLVVCVEAPATTYFSDDFSSFTGWTYQPASQGAFASNGSRLFVSTWGDGFVAARKPLASAIGPGDDFRFSLTMDSGSDGTDVVGSLVVALLDASGQIVAKMDWFDAQSATGFGGVDFYGESDTAIFRSDPSGFASDYPTLAGTLTLRRVGPTWSASVDDVPKGSLTLAPTFIATQMEIVADRAVGYIPRDVTADLLTVTPEPGALPLFLMGALALARRRSAGVSHAANRSTPMTGSAKGDILVF